MARTQHGAAESVPAATRWFVRAFLVAFAVCAIFRLEVWPLTGFRLFSTVRHESHAMWVAETVGLDGRQTRLWFSDFPRAYQGFYLITPGFRRLPPARKMAICSAWLSEARRVRWDVRSLRLYRETWRALPRRGDRAAPAPPRELVYACS
jgi:hypothetical protein